MILAYPTLSKRIDDLTEMFNSDLKYLKEWLPGNSLLFNVKKTQAEVIRYRPNRKEISEKAVNSPTFVVEYCPEEVIDSVKYLGVQVDKYLVWDEQIKSVQAKVSRSSGF